MMARGNVRSLLAIAVLAVPGSAAAAGTVTVDPNSPAGTEYQIPIQTARQQGSGQKDGQLFGEGIKKDGASKPTGETKRTDSGKSKPKAGDATMPTTTAASAPAPANAPANLTADHPADSGSGSAVLIALLMGALLVLAGAGWGGLKMRRRPE